MKTRMKKWLSLFLTAVMLFGTFAVAMPVMVLTASAESEYTNVPANTTVNVNGVNIRYDRYSGNDDGYVHVMPNGTIEFKIRHGDMVWFPDVVMTDSSTVHGEVTVISGTAAHSGFAYNVAKSGDTWASTMIVGYNNGGRVRIAGDTKAKLGNNNGGDGYGSGGDSRRPFNGDIANSKKGLNEYYLNVQNVNNEVAIGKTVGVDLRKADGKVYVDWLAIDCGPYHSVSYNDNTSTAAPYLYAGGSVGYSILYQGYGDNDKGAAGDHSEYIVRRLEALDLTNCKVNGVETAAWSAVGTKMVPHTDTVVNGVTYRFDPLETSKLSSCRIMADNTFRLHVSAGDLFWMPGTENAAGGTMTAKMIANNGQKNNGNLAAGIAYHIDLGANGTWGDADDSLNTAHLQTSWRRRIIHASVSGMNSSSTALGIVSTYTLEEVNRNQAYQDFGDRWNNGDVLKTDISINENGYVYTSFRDANDVQMSFDYYVPEHSGNKVLDGPIGFVAFWDGDGSERHPMTVDILSLAAKTEGVKDVALNTTLDGAIGMNFHFHAATYVANNANLVVTKAGTEIFNKPVKELWDSAKREYVGSVPVCAKEINDEVNFSLKIGDTVYDGQTYTTSVASYAETLKEDATWGDLAAAILDYGNAAENYFNEATNVITGAAPTNLEDVAPITYADGSDLTILDEESRAVFMSLVLEGTTTLKLYFKPNGDVTVEEFGGSEVTTTTDDRNPGYQVISIENIAADDLSDEYAFEVTETESGKSFAFTVSALSWAKAAYEKGSDATKDLAKTIANYAAAADAITGEGPAF